MQHPHLSRCSQQARNNAFKFCMAAFLKKGDCDVRHAPTRGASKVMAVTGMSLPAGLSPSRFTMDEAMSNAQIEARAPPSECPTVVMDPTSGNLDSRMLIASCTWPCKSMINKVCDARLALSVRNLNQNETSNIS